MIRIRFRPVFPRLPWHLRRMRDNQRTVPGHPRARFPPRDVTQNLFWLASWNRVMHWLGVVSVLARQDPSRLYLAGTLGYGIV